jgi:putative ABC transport system permease protein
VILVVCVIVILSIFNTMNMSVLERTTEIGTVMAMGMRPTIVVRLFLYEGLVLGLIGGALGLILGAAVVKLAAAVGIPMPPPPGATMEWLSTPALVPMAMIRSFVLSVMIAAISGIYPAYKASRMEIAQALRHVL